MTSLQKGVLSVIGAIVSAYLSGVFRIVDLVQLAIARAPGFRKLAVVLLVWPVLLPWIFIVRLSTSYQPKILHALLETK